MKPEVAISTAACPHPERWHCHDDQATEVEVLSFLTSLVRMLKPKLLVETGCYDGYGTTAIWLGMEEDAFLYTCDLGEDKVRATEQKMLNCRGVAIHHSSGLDLITSMPFFVDFAFLDSGPDEVRCHELRALHPKLKDGGIVAVHDVAIQHGLRPHFFRTVKELGMEFITFDTPRGLALARKPWI